MIEYRRKCYAKVIKALQLLTFILAFLLSFLAFPPNIPINTSFAINRHSELFIYALFCAGAIYIITTNISSRYLTSNMASLQGNALYISSTSLVICGGLCLITLFFFKRLFPIYPLIFIVITPIIYIPAQALLNHIFAYIYNRPRNQRHILIVGSNQRAIEYAEYIDRLNFLGFKVLGFVENRKNMPSTFHKLGTFSDFRRIIRENIIDAVVITLPIRTFYDVISELIAITEEQGIATYSINNFFESKNSEIAVNKHKNTTSIVFHSAPLEDWKMLLKRLISFVGAIIAIMLTLPLMIIISIAIFVQDPGPIFYVQKRIGYRKRIFNLYKFRSMYQNAQEMQSSLESMNEMDGPVFKIKNDPRIFPVGRILRRFALDELPQFFNVLKGDMNFVGPRPLALRDYRGFREDWLRRRFSVPPGLTCYWQSMTNRNNIPFEEWMMLDMQYINNWNLWEDIKICLKTIHTVLAGKGV